MAKPRVDLLELLRKEAPDADMDFLRERLKALGQAVMEAEETAKTGAGYGQRSPERLTHRDGYRPLPWDTRVGTLELRIPHKGALACRKAVWRSLYKARGMPRRSVTPFSRRK